MLALEVLEEDLTGDFAQEAFGSAKNSANKTSDRLQFCRMAFGAMGGINDGMDSGEAERQAVNYAKWEKVTLTWQGARQILPKNHSKLMLNLVLLCLECVSKGDEISLKFSDHEGKPHIRLEARGKNPRLPKTIDTALKGLWPSGAPFDTRAIQPYYTRLLAESVGVEISASREGEMMVIEAKMVVSEAKFQTA